MIADASHACMSHALSHSSVHSDSPCTKTLTACADLRSSGLTFPFGRVPRPILLIGTHKSVLTSFKIRRKK